MVGDLNGSVKPCYTSVYGLLNLRYNENRKALEILSSVVLISMKKIMRGILKGNWFI
jgi:hypothetical protein